MSNMNLLNKQSGKASGCLTIVLILIAIPILIGVVTQIIHYSNPSNPTITDTEISKDKLLSDLTISGFYFTDEHTFTKNNEEYWQAKASDHISSLEIIGKDDIRKITLMKSYVSNFSLSDGIYIFASLLKAVFPNWEIVERTNWLESSMKKAIISGKESIQKNNCILTINYYKQTKWFLLSIEFNK